MFSTPQISLRNECNCYSIHLSFSLQLVELGSTKLRPGTTLARSVQATVLPSIMPKPHANAGKDSTEASTTDWTPHAQVRLFT